MALVLHGQSGPLLSGEAARTVQETDTQGSGRSELLGEGFKSKWTTSERVVRAVCRVQIALPHFVSAVVHATVSLLVKPPNRRYLQYAHNKGSNFLSAAQHIGIQRMM